MFEHFWRVRVTIFSANFGVIGLFTLVGWLIGRSTNNPRLGIILGALISLPVALIVTVAAVKKQAPDIVERTIGEQGLGNEEEGADEREVQRQ